MNIPFSVAAAVHESGGELFYVGGCVRDKYLNRESKDIDMVVVGLDPETFESIMTRWKAKKVGVSFETYKIDDFEFALARRERSTGTGHTDFEVETNEVSLVEDLSRRDFTMNAIAKNVLTGVIVDPFGGVSDIKNKIIRANGVAKDMFSEDPLRMLRALQFAARFEMKIEDSTFDCIKMLIEMIDTVAGERVFEEFKKVWTLPSIQQYKAVTFYRLLKSSGLGTQLFGPGYFPCPIMKSSTVEPDTFYGDADDLINVNFALSFLVGGDPARLKPTNENMDYLHTANTILDTSTNVERLFQISNHKNKLPILSDAFRGLGLYEHQAMCDWVFSLPLRGSELVVNGEQLLSMGFEGKQLGQIQRAWLLAIWTGQLLNSEQSLLEFLQANHDIILQG